MPVRPGEPNQSSVSSSDSSLLTENVSKSPGQQCPDSENPFRNRRNKTTSGRIPSGEESRSRLNNRRNNPIRRNIRNQKTISSELSVVPEHDRTLPAETPSSKPVPIQESIDKISQTAGLNTAQLDPEYDYTVLVQPGWMAQWPNFGLFFVSALAILAISLRFEALLIDFKLPLVGITVGIPYLLALPFFFIGKAIFKTCNIYATMGNKKLMYHTGCLTVNHRKVEMESDAMQVVQVTQTPMGKMLNYGTISVGRFSRKSLEFDIHGVSNPHKVLKKIKRKIKIARDQKLKANGPSSVVYEGEFDDMLDDAEKYGYDGE
jgi:hypothetical protein